MKELSYEETEFLHLCAREGPTRLDPDLGHALEKRGFVVFLYEGLKMQGRWRLTNAGRRALQGSEESF